MAYPGAPATTTYAQYAEQPMAYSGYASASPTAYASQPYGAPVASVMPDISSMAQYSAAPYATSYSYGQSTDAAYSAAPPTTLAPAATSYTYGTTAQMPSMSYGTTMQTPSYTPNYGTSVTMPSFQPPSLQMPTTGSFVATASPYGYGGPTYGAYGMPAADQYGAGPALSTQSFAYAGATPYQFQFYPDYGKDDSKPASKPADKPTGVPSVDKPKPPPKAATKPAPKAAKKKTKKRCGCC